MILFLISFAILKFQKIKYLIFILIGIITFSNLASFLFLTRNINYSTTPAYLTQLSEDCKNKSVFSLPNDKYLRVPYNPVVISTNPLEYGLNCNYVKNDVNVLNNVKMTLSSENEMGDKLNKDIENFTNSMDKTKTGYDTLKESFKKENVGFIVIWDKTSYLELVKRLNEFTSPYIENEKVLVYNLSI